jgi:hypothetical protein
MKIIDQTPFFNPETGEIGFLDRGKATLKYGTSWLKEIDAQTKVMAVMSKLLDRNFTLLRNITPPGLEATFPFILIGPTGVFVMYVTPLTGTFRAKGDQWGTISGNTFRDEKPNLLTRTERMARAIQIFLQRQGYMELTNIEAILLFSDPSVNVDSLRPIIRVVMRDALERFLISITQSRVVLTPDGVQKLVERILNPPKPTSPQSETTAQEEGITAKPIQTDVFTPPILPKTESKVPIFNNEPTFIPIVESQTISKVPLWKGLNKKHWVFLISVFVIWCLLVSAFLILVVKDQVSSILSLLP